jgi:hypothetical protein
LHTTLTNLVPAFGGSILYVPIYENRRMKAVLRGVMTLAAFITCLALLMMLAKRWPWVGAAVNGAVIGGLVVCLLVGSVWKIRRVAKGDPRPTRQFGWLPRRWQAWLYQDDTIK